VLDLNQRPRDSGSNEFPRSLDYLIALGRTGRAPGARVALIGLAPHAIVSAPSRLPILRPAFGGLGSGLPGGDDTTDGFPEFTRFFLRRLHTAVTF
jgi:hypothetical protein